jgi:hypothetical protein
MPKHRSRPIPAIIGLDPMLRGELENERLARNEELDDVRQSMRDQSDQMRAMNEHLRRFEALLQRNDQSSQQMLGYCRAVADRVLEHMGVTMPAAPPSGALPPMRERVPTLRDVQEIAEDAVAKATGGRTLSQHVALKLDERELQSDAQTWRDIKKAARSGMWDAIRKGVGVALIVAAAWAAGYVHRVLTSPQTTVAPGGK